MKKENWLELVTRADAEQFAYNHMNIEKLSMLGEFSDFSYGKYIGIEANEQYCVWAEQRLAMAEADMSIQGYVNGVFWERNTLSEQPTQKSEKKKLSPRKKKPAIDGDEQLTIL